MALIGQVWTVFFVSYDTHYPIQTSNEEIKQCSAWYFHCANGSWQLHIALSNSLLEYVINRIKVNIRITFLSDKNCPEMILTSQVAATTPSMPVSEKGSNCLSSLEVSSAKRRLRLTFWQGICTRHACCISCHLHGSKKKIKTTSGRHF